MVILLSAHLVEVYPLFFVLFVQACCGYVYMTVILMIAEPDNFEVFSRDVIWGGFGYFTKEEFVNGFLWYGQSAGFWGLAGYKICLLFFTPFVIASAFLTEVFISQLFGYLLNINKFPGYSTCVGTVIVIIGSLLVIEAERLR